MRRATIGAQVVGYDGLLLDAVAVIGLVAGVVAAGFGVGVTVLGVAELGKRPGAEHDTEAGLAEADGSATG